MRRRPRGATAIPTPRWPRPCAPSCPTWPSRPSPRSSSRSRATPTRSSGDDGQTIDNAVQLALGGFLALAAARAAPTRARPSAPALEGAYELGRGEARSGRSMDALLAAYRVGARVVVARADRDAVDGRARPRAAGRGSPSWSSPTSTSCRPPASPGTPTSSRRPAGCGSATWSGSPTQLLAARPERTLDGGRGARRLDAAATLTAVIAPGGAGARRAGSLDGRTLRSRPDVPGLDAARELAVLLVPDADGPARPALLRALAGATPSSGRPGLAARCGRRTPGRCRALQLGLAADGSDRSTPSTTWPSWCSAPTPRRSPTCAPRCSRRCADLRPGAAEKLDRDAAGVAAAPGPARGRRGRAVRAPADGALPDGPAARAVRRPAGGPATVLELTIALGRPRPRMTSRKKLSYSSSRVTP